MRPLRAPTFSAVKRWHRALEKAEATRFAWRKTSASMDLYACPDPHEFAPLFQAAATDWNAIRDPLKRVLFCGLAVLLIHPLVDGNGRLSRLIWREQLCSSSVNPERVEAVLERVFTCERNRFIASVAESRRGKPGVRVRAAALWVLKMHPLAIRPRFLARQPNRCGWLTCSTLRNAASAAWRVEWDSSSNLKRRLALDRRRWR